MSSESASVDKKLSSSLKERLKRCGRYHSSPSGPPTKKRIYYPDSTSPQTPVLLGNGREEAQDSCQGLLSSPAMLYAVGVGEVLETGSGQIPTPLRSSNSEKLKASSTTPANRKTKFPSSSKATYSKLAPTTPTLDSNFSQKTQETKSYEIGRTISVIASPIASDENNSYDKRQSEGVGHVDLCSSTPDTVRLVNKNIATGVSEAKSEQRFERTPIRSRNVSSCKPSRLHFSDLSSDSHINSDTEGTSAHACKQKEQVGSQITPTEQTESDARSVSSEDTMTLQEKHEKLKNTLTEKEEELRKLNMVKMYRAKNDLDSLGLLINKWRRTSQQALVDLHSKLPDPKPSLTQLIDHLQIEHSLVHFNPEEETFN